MKLLIINPNISQSVTELIAAEAARTASPGTMLTTLTAPSGVAYIETRFEALLGAWSVANLAAEHLGEHDAVIIAAFGDPGLMAMQEVLPCPVVGLTQASLASASLLGNRISIVAISSRIRVWYRETVAQYGLLGRLASIRGLDAPLSDISSVQQDQGSRLVEIAHRCVAEDGADVIILAGAPLAGLARQVGARLPVPVVDGVSSAVRQAEGLVRQKPQRPKAGSFAPPPDKPHQGLPEALAALLEGSRRTARSQD
jgi:Asp/Glu/hydantoin racemase